MLTEYVQRGVKAGVVAGILFGLLIALVANPLVAFADELQHEPTAGAHADEAGGAEHGHGAEAGVVSTLVTNAVSVVSGVLWGVLLGGVVFGAAYYFLEPLLPGSGAVKSYVLGAAGFVTASGAPWLVLPPQPPGVEQAVGTETRLLLYGGMMVAGALVCLGSMFVYSRLADTHGRLAAGIAALLPVGLLVVPAVLAPVPPVESAIDPVLASGLTGMIVFGQLLLWFLLAGAHARFRRSADGRPSATSHLDTGVTPETAD